MQANPTAWSRWRWPTRWPASSGPSWSAAKPTAPLRATPNLRAHRPKHENRTTAPPSTGGASGKELMPSDGNTVEPKPGKSRHGVKPLRRRRPEWNPGNGTHQGQRQSHTAQTGRTHDRSRPCQQQQRISLAKTVPSTHDPRLRGQAARARHCQSQANAKMKDLMVWTALL